MRKITYDKVIRILELIGYKDVFEDLVDYYKSNIPNLNTTIAYSNIFNNLLRLDNLSKELGIENKDIIKNIKPYLIMHDIPKSILKAYLLFPGINMEHLLTEVMKNPKPFEEYLDLYQKSMNTTYTMSEQNLIDIEMIAKKYHILTKIIQNIKDPRLEFLDAKTKFGLISYAMNKNIDIESKLNLTPDHLIPVMFRKVGFLALDDMSYRQIIYKIEFLFGIDKLKDREFLEKIYEAGFKGKMNPLLKSYLANQDNYLPELCCYFKSMNIKIDWYNLLKNLDNPLEINKIDMMVYYYKLKGYPPESIFEREEFYKGDLKAITRLRPYNMSTTISYDRKSLNDKKDNSKYEEHNSKIKPNLRNL